MFTQDLQQAFLKGGREGVRRREGGWRGEGRGRGAYYVSLRFCGDVFKSDELHVTVG